MVARQHLTTAWTGVSTGTNNLARSARTRAPELVRHRDHRDTNLVGHLPVQSHRYGRDGELDNAVVHHKRSARAAESGYADSPGIRPGRSAHPNICAICASTASGERRGFTLYLERGARLHFT